MVYEYQKVVFESVMQNNNFVLLGELIHLNYLTGLFKVFGMFYLRISVIINLETRQLTWKYDDELGKMTFKLATSKLTVMFPS